MDGELHEADSVSARPNPYTIDAATSPLPHYQQLRQCPVTPFLSGTYLVARYDDVRSVLHAPDMFSSDMDAIWIGQRRPMIPLQIDPPAHGAYRQILDPLFSPSAVEPLRPAIEDLVNDTIDAIDGRHTIDFHSEISVPIASTAFLTLMGLPIAEAGRFISWKDAIIRPGTTMRDVAAGHQVRERAAREMYERFAFEASLRRTEPRDDWLTRLVTAELDGRHLTDEEVQDICFVLFLGGLDTVTAALDCAILHLARTPADRARIIDRADLLPRAIEEMLRHETPVMQVPRVVRAPCEIQGHRFDVGDRVRVVLGAANTDERHFAEADEVHLDRTANRHVAFGAGPHRCLGMHLARLELHVALATWHRRVPNYSLDDSLPIEVTPVIREIPRLPLLIDSVHSR